MIRGHKVNRGGWAVNTHKADWQASPIHFSKMSPIYRKTPDKIGLETNTCDV